MLRDHFAPLLLAPSFLAPVAERLPAVAQTAGGHRAERTEQLAEGELRRDDDREKDRRQDDDHRSCAIEVVRQEGGQPLARITAGAKRFARDLERAEQQTEQRAEAGQQQRRAGGLRSGGVEPAAPERVPTDDHENRRNEIRRIAEQLKRQLRDEGADPAREIADRRVTACGRAEEPHRILRVVAGERDDPDQRRGEQRHAHELARPA